jgi:hypothetical protein
VHAEYIHCITTGLHVEVVVFSCVLGKHALRSSYLNTSNSLCAELHARCTALKKRPHELRSCETLLWFEASRWKTS